MTGQAMTTLVIVMGTSGSGKSTVGSALSAALGCAFVDGDDLHPASNVDKMSRGQPLNDQDREPWLITIRRTGLELATSQTLASDALRNKEKSQSAKLAEVYETSRQSTSQIDLAAESSSIRAKPQPSQAHSNKHIAVIACSSLKLIYRRLLRGTIPSLTHPTASQPESQLPSDLQVIHIYLDLSKQLLEHRMSNRKGHFMKLDMLYSQLDTLQVPDEHKEFGVIKVKVESETTTDEIVKDAMDQLKQRGVI